MKIDVNDEGEYIAVHPREAVCGYVTQSRMVAIKQLSTDGNESIVIIAPSDIGAVIKMMRALANEARGF